MYDNFEMGFGSIFCQFDNQTTKYILLYTLTCFHTQNRLKSEEDMGIESK
jgi:hypothetical protein